MDKKELIHTMRSAEHEIQRLRKQNELQGAQLEIVNIFGALVNLNKPTPAQGMCIDSALQLHHQITKLEKELAEPVRVGLDADLVDAEFIPSPEAQAQ